VTSEAGDVIADEKLAELLECPVGQRWVRVVGLRYAGQDKLPIAMTHVYINAAYGSIQKLVGTLRVPVYTLLEKEYGVTIVEVKQQISARTISPADADQLHVKPRSAGLVVVRHYFADNGLLLEVTVSLHPSDRFSYSMSLRLPRA
jgi:DNA-binding GntR family transcriptional regulator